ncbi:MAG: sodium:proton antiporter [Thermoguttaceae bacterium]|jgi:Na+/H+ antiporter NhaD/arsenite permease-like protein
MSGAPKTPQTEEPITYRKTLLALGVFFIVYIILLFVGLPQKWTNAQFAHHGEAEAIESIDEPTLTLQAPDSQTTEEAEDAGDESAVAAETISELSQGAEALDESPEEPIPPLWTALPFVLLLLCIAFLPLIPGAERWWESNLNRFLVAAVLGFVTLAYYAFICDFPIDLHWPAHKVVDPSTGPLAMAGTVFANAILGEYISFIVLLFSLFAITGGIRIQGNLLATPLTNTCILAFGTLIASFVGTTGAAMILIRLLLDTNRDRRHKVHTFIFFIFCVCNIGGCLLPIGDPPLFLGYLRGVNFLWTLSLWKEWLFTSAILLVVYYVWDTFCYRKETGLDKTLDVIHRSPLKVSGLFPNLLCLLGVILGVMLLDPAQEFLSLFGVKTGWYPPFFLREFVQLLMVAISFLFGSNAIRKANHFDFHAILEVAALFFGIFICMQAPLQILHVKGAKLAETVHHYGSKIRLNEPKEFFWTSGTLSSILDNAPTYVVFFETARAAAEGELADAIKSGNTELAEEMEMALVEGEKTTGVRIPIQLLIAISLGSVFMGSMTYIGNGPNFMVKSIAEQNGIKMPSFFGYMVYSFGILTPIFIVMTIIFL